MPVSVRKNVEADLMKSISTTTDAAERAKLEHILDMLRQDAAQNGLKQPLHQTPQPRGEAPRWSAGARRLSRGFGCSATPFTPRRIS
jgi:hypothetical protein